MTGSTSVDSIVRTAVDQIEDITRTTNEEFLLNLMNAKTESNYSLAINSNEVSKEDNFKILAKLLEQLSLESTDSQILSQVQHLLKCKRNKTQEVIMNLKPKRYSQSRPLLDQYKSGLKVIKQSISSLQIIKNLLK
jgi:hypothetical protein